jgi:predicted N-acetyltransferase YhbS
VHCRPGRSPSTRRRRHRLRLAPGDVVGDQLVGVSRAISDFSYCTYLSDLAVDQAQQGHGIGRELIRRTHETGGLDTHLILIAAPKSQTYYPHIGMQQRESCWVIPRRIPHTS